MKRGKRTKWLLAAALSATMIFSATACGSKEAAKKESDKTVTVETKENKEEKVAQVHGVIKAYTGGTMVIETDKGDQLNFGIANARIECANGIVSGDEVTIEYTGVINGSDTSHAVVTKIVDKGGKKALEEHKISGTVSAVAMHTLTIKDNNGKEYSFMTTGAETHYKNGIQAGNWVTVVYEGELTEETAQNVKVKSITDEDPNIKEEQEKVKITDVDKTMYAVAALRIRSSYTTDSDSIGLFQAGESVHVTGETDNGWARVSYDGMTGYAYEVYLSDEKPAEETEAPEPEAKPEPETQPQPDEPVANPEVHDTEVYTMSGVLKDATMHIAVVTSDADGQDYTFNISEAEVRLPSGLVMGQTVTVNYMGEATADSTTSTVLSMEGSMMNGDLEEAYVMEGRIIATSMNCMTILTGEGIEVTFDIEDAQINCENGLLMDWYVSVTYIFHEDSNIYNAISVDDLR